MALARLAMPSPNYSSRGGATVSTVVLHTAEGALTIQSLGSFFANPSSGVSSHVGIDDTPGTVGEYVPRSGSSWTAAGANKWSVQAELCAFAKWDLATWNTHPQMLANTAAWIAEECAFFGIPIVGLSAADAQNPNARGVCQHNDLGSMGGGHWDCGPGFPFAQVLQMAAGGAGPAPIPTPSIGDDNMVLTDPATGGVWVVADPTGAVWTYDGAPFLGGTNNPKMNAANYPCVGIAAYTDASGPGYQLVLDWGDSGKGDGKSKDGTGDRYRRYRFPRNGSGRA
jgi:hypothetical protein